LFGILEDGNPSCISLRANLSENLAMVTTMVSMLAFFSRQFFNFRGDFEEMA